MRFHPELERAFLAARNAALARSDTGVAALSWCLWLTQLSSFALSGQKRMCGKVRVGGGEALRRGMGEGPRRGMPAERRLAAARHRLKPKAAAGGFAVPILSSAAAPSLANECHGGLVAHLSPLLRPHPIPMQAALLLALNFIPLAEGRNWTLCRSRNRCLTLLKLCLFALLCWEVGRCGSGGGAAPAGAGGPGPDPAPGGGGLLRLLQRSCSGRELPADAAAPGQAPAGTGACSQDQPSPSFPLGQLGLAADVCLPGEKGAAQEAGSPLSLTALLSEVGQVSWRCRQVYPACCRCRVSMPQL